MSAAPTDITGANTPEIQTNTIETAKPTPEALQQDPAFAAKFAALARREKALQRRDQELKTKEQSWLAEKAKYETDYLPKSRLKENPLNAITESGLSQDELINLILNGPTAQDQAYNKLQAEIQALKDDNVKAKTSQEEQQTKAYENAVTQIRNDAKILIEKDERFQTIKALDSIEAVVELIKSNFDETGSVLSIEDAADQVENYLIEEGLKFAQLDKVKAKLNPPPPPAPEVQKLQSITKPHHTQTVAREQNTRPSVAIKTLTNAQNASSQPLNALDKRQRAILAFQGKLNS